MQFQTIKKESQAGAKPSPKHESYIAKIFNYNTSQKSGILKKELPLQDHQLFSYFMITKSLQSVKLQESPIQKCKADQTKKKKVNRVVFKTEIDENKNLQLGFQTQRKSYDCVAVDNKINSFNLISSMFELESKNMDLYMDLQDKTTQIQQMQTQIEQQQIKHQQQIRQYSQEKKELLLKQTLLQFNRIQNLEKQSELQRKYIEQLPQFEVEAQEWKIRFLKLNKQYHLQQETLVRLEAEQQSSQRRRTDGFNCFKQQL
ncbi:unnamed protein product (macronuclear) [Paramecium tetraurelia]|uniref:Uncharacterized protein n=1 Tax=Paramecium tetraurelia TaxID=5888 RepID=A0BFH5_PARTE|nr:uncharacterized protein GSPATT00028327001 [Paramecium tetraurelia]CAK57292.1 unnamed protein product [Paramecium tetraurelia]|eukprot:XP_001424690.1 hypothetical protein (macronuclear) [Paramecium tetraurelia strain d4-2]